jgi:hypothetical protein
MRTTIKIIVVLSLVWVLLVGHVFAFNVTPSGAGTTWITWDWDNPSNVTEMRIDGALLCGYESTLPSVNVIGMRSNSCHNLSIISNVGSGWNISCTLVGNASRGGGGGVTTGNDLLNTSNILYGMIGALVGGVVLLGYFMKRE